MRIPSGSTSVSTLVQIVDNNGLPVTGLVAATFPAVDYCIVGAAEVAIPLHDLASASTPYGTAGGLFEIGGGVYRLDLPDAMFTNPATAVRLIGEVSGKHLLHPVIEVAAVASGSGPYVVTITVTDTLSNPIQNATVQLSINASLYTAQTNSSGVATLAPNEGKGTYSVVLTASGYSQQSPIPATLVVTGNTPHTYTMSQISVTPSSPGLSTGYITCFGANGLALGNVVFIRQWIAPAANETGNSPNSDELSAISASNGVAQFPNHFPGHEYRVQRWPRGPWVNYIAGNSTFQIPDVPGSDGH